MATSTSSGVTLKKFREEVIYVAQNLTQEQSDDLAYLHDLPVSIRDKHPSPREVLEQLEARDIISHTKPETLVGVLRDIERKQLARKVKKNLGLRSRHPLKSFDDGFLCEVLALRESYETIGECLESMQITVTDEPDNTQRQELIKKASTRASPHAEKLRFRLHKIAGILEEDEDQSLQFHGFTANSSGEEELDHHYEEISSVGTSDSDGEKLPVKHAVQETHEVSRIPAFIKDFQSPDLPVIKRLSCHIPIGATHEEPHQGSDDSGRAQRPVPPPKPKRLTPAKSITNSEADEDVYEMPVQRESILLSTAAHRPQTTDDVGTARANRFQSPAQPQATQMVTGRTSSTIGKHNEQSSAAPPVPPQRNHPFGVHQARLQVTESEQSHVPDSRRYPSSSMQRSGPPKTSPKPKGRSSRVAASTVQSGEEPESSDYSGGTGTGDSGFSDARPFLKQQPRRSLPIVSTDQQGGSSDTYYKSLQQTEGAPSYYEELNKDRTTEAAYVEPTYVELPEPVYQTMS